VTSDGGGRRAAEFGATEFLTEPVDFEHLKAQLRNCPAAWIEEDRRPIE
jgi:hypothetical protein